jgi:hypothetical protein
MPASLPYAPHRWMLRRRLRARCLAGGGEREQSGADVPLALLLLPVHGGSAERSRDASASFDAGSCRRCPWCDAAGALCAAPKEEKLSWSRLSTQDLLRWGRTAAAERHASSEHGTAPAAAAQRESSEMLVVCLLLRRLAAGAGMAACKSSTSSTGPRHAARRRSLFASAPPEQRDAP